jgi:hypothetical protein
VSGILHFSQIGVRCHVKQPTSRLMDTCSEASFVLVLVPGIEYMYLVAFENMIRVCAETEGDVDA